MNTPATPNRTAIAIDIDPPFQQVLAVWLRARSYSVSFVPLSAAIEVGRPIDLVICELALPKQCGGETLRQIARTHPDASVIAISPRFVVDARHDTLARQLGVQAALAKPCSRYDFDRALDAAVAMPSNTAHSHDDHPAVHRPRHPR